MIRVVYFDYHGVLDKRSFRGLLNCIAQASGQPDTTAVTTQLESYVYQYVTGVLRPHEFWRTIEDRYGNTANRAGRQYYLHVDPDREMWNLLSTLHDQFELGLMTDCSGDKKEVIRSAYALTDYFDYLIFSCDTTLTKRDVGFYQLMSQAGKFEKNECMLVDDREANCQLAIDQGFQAHLFNNAQTLQGHLERIH